MGSWQVKLHSQRPKNVRRGVKERERSRDGRLWSYCFLDVGGSAMFSVLGLHEKSLYHYSSFSIFYLEHFSGFLLLTSERALTKGSINILFLAWHRGPFPQRCQTIPLASCPTTPVCPSPTNQLHGTTWWIR